MYSDKNSITDIMIIQIALGRILEPSTKKKLHLSNAEHGHRLENRRIG